MLKLLQFLLRFLPWWLWVALAVLLSPAGISGAFHHVQQAQTFQAARGQAAPLAVDAVAFDPARDAAPWGEVSLRGVRPATRRAAPVPGDAAGRLFVIAADLSGQTLVALVGGSRDAEDLHHSLTGLRSDGPPLAGIYLAPDAAPNLYRALRHEIARLSGADHRLIVVEPFAQGRDAGLAEARNLGIFIGLILAALAAAPILAAGISWRYGRRQRRVSRSAPRKARGAAKISAASPWEQEGGPGAATLSGRRTPRKAGRAPVPKGDGFDHSPIKSRRGGFWF